MGMSASQVRYLGLTARRNNNEFEAQQVCEQKTMLAMQMDMVATDYTKKTSNRELLFVQMDASANSSKKVQLTYDIITNTNPFSGLNMRVVDADGKVIVPNDQTAYFDQLVKSAVDAKDKALNNKYFAQTITNTDGSISERLLDGKNFISSYLSGLNDKPIYDKDGNQINIDEFKEKIKLMDAHSFNDFWNSNKYSSADFDPINDPKIKSKAYTADDNAATVAYEAEIARINDLRSIQYKTDLNCLDPVYLENKLRTGEWSLEKHDLNASDVNGEWKSISWQSEASIDDALDKSDDAQAENEYTQQSAFFQRQDKVLELRMKQLDTEHSAIQTEMDSVKKVIDKNVESSFKTFG